jgi:hypothetical protein
MGRLAVLVTAHESESEVVGIQGAALSLDVFVIQRVSKRPLGQVGKRRHGTFEHERECGDHSRSVRRGLGIDETVVQVLP